MRTIIDMRFIQRDGKQVLQQQVAFMLNQAVSYSRDLIDLAQKGPVWEDVRTEITEKE